MNRDTFIDTLNVFHDKMRDLLTKKGEDYAEVDDLLSNFKKVAAITESNPLDITVTTLGLKIVRLGNLLGKTPNNESIEDTLLDLANYAFLAYAILKESTTDPARPDIAAQ